MAKKRRILKIAGVLFVLLLVVYFSLPRYAQRALIYTTAGIEDYTIFENRAIETAIPQPWPVDAAVEKINLSADQQNYLEEMESVAFLVLKDGRIIYEQYWEEYGPNSLSNSFSMAKSVVALLVGAAIDDGFIGSVEEPVSKYIPQFNNESNRNLTIKEVLTMSSGLNWDESYGSLFSKTTEAYYGKDINQLIVNLEMAEKPGVEFKYLSGNTQVLAMVVEAATGKRISDYVSEKFWEPMGAENQALWSLDDKDGMEKAYCCFNSNARDFARWGQLILNNGVWNGDTLLSPGYVQEATSPAGLIDKDGNPADYYGYQWWIHHFENQSIPYMRGILGQYVFVLHEQNAVIVRLGHQRSDTYQNNHPMDTYEYLETGLDIIKQYEALKN
jgi:CubicO group peptidase (beta-lactamase class C family)